MDAIDPVAASRNPELLLLDFRPPHERHRGVGFIPGSLGMVLSDDPQGAAEQLAALGSAKTPVLVCTSGTRAGALVQRIGPLLEGRLTYLEGGVLGWSAAGLPLCACSCSTAATEAVSPEDLPRELAACFVGELAELSLDRDLDPMALLRLAFERAGQSFDTPNLDELHAVVDQAALLSLELGTPLERVAANVDHILALLPQQRLSRSA